MKFHSSGDNDNDNDKNVETTPHTQSEENHLMAYVFVSMCVYVCVWQRHPNLLYTAITATLL